MSGHASALMRVLRIAFKLASAGALLLVGTVLLVLPGPGIPFLIGAVAILATEFAWAAALQTRMVTLWRQVGRRAH